ncbi:helix-turn-helix transcriptional regulator [Adhaeribacter aquaticus]|uniref:helix-turn-helix transcriptional regulator n=1 Tax=Adhaeribacter aquaticus TaxID=299567 RepID=UPI0004796E50|nr:helix-turn-helix transcriptional regulator [Adhaeribacter aquaticus]
MSIFDTTALSPNRPTKKEISKNNPDYTLHIFCFEEEIKGDRECNLYILKWLVESGAEIDVYTPVFIVQVGESYGKDKLMKWTTQNYLSTGNGKFYPRKAIGEQIKNGDILYATFKETYPIKNTTPTPSMPKLYNEDIETQIRNRFIQKVDNLIAAGLADTYADICRSINIKTASLNQIKSGKSKPTLEMLYNLQSVYGILAEDILFEKPPKPDVQLLTQQIKKLQGGLDEILSSIKQ